MLSKRVEMFSGKMKESKPLKLQFEQWGKPLAGFIALLLPLPQPKDNN